MSRKSLCFLLVTVFLFMVFSPTAATASEEEYDPQHTMLTLNMAVMSIYRITSTADRIVLDQEYRNILNNLSIGNIEDDSEIIDLYEEILDVITYEKLRDEETKRFNAAYERNVKNSMLQAASGIRAYGGNLWSFVGSLVTSAASAYFDYRFSKEQYKTDLGESLWGLQKERILDLNDLRKQLLRSSWRLLRQYNLPDEYRITEENLKLFTKGIEEEDPQKALFMFDALREDFKAYPPFWCFYGHAAQELGDNDLAKECYASFDNVYRKVLRRDPFLVEVCKKKILLLNPYTQQEEIRNCAELIAENSSPQDWLNNLVAGVQLYLLGDKETANRYVMQNVAFESETELSSMLLEAMKKGKLRKEELPEVLRDSVQVVPSAEKLAARGDGQEALAQGLERYFQGEYAQALDYFKIPAKTDIPLGLYMCYRMYDLGQGVEKNLEASQEYKKQYDAIIEKSVAGYKENVDVIQTKAEEANPNAQFLLGRMYDHGHGVPENVQEAAKWYRKAAEQGDTRAQFNLGWMYHNGDGVPKDLREAVKWYRKATEQGDADAQCNLGWMYHNGDGVPKDLREAVKWYRKAAEQGDTQAQFNLGWMYYNGDGVPKDLREAVKWYRKAAEQGDARAQFNLGVMYQYGDGVPKDTREAVKWYRKAAEQGHADAQFLLAEALYNGNSISQNFGEAAKWYRKAAEQENANAQNKLGLMYIEGSGFLTLEDDTEAVKWLRKAAEQGYAKGQSNLALMYFNGRGVSQNYQETVKWYRKAAEQGYAEAQNLLGVMYTKGEGVPQDNSKAAEWFRKAAEQGHADAQCNLGIMYANGDGVQQNYREAVKWYRKAAEQGKKHAQYYLGWKYKNGDGVPQDMEAAYMWFYIAASNGREGAREQLDELGGKGMLKLKKLSSQEIARAKRKAQEFLANQQN